MGDFGIKILKAGANVNSTTVDDYIFSSKYQSLPLLYKTTQTINVSSGSCNGTHTYTHSLGWKPLTLGFVTSKVTAQRESIPFNVSDASKLYCGGDNLNEDFSLKVKDNTIEVIYDITCIIPMVGSRCIDLSTSYSVDLYVFMFELGSS